MGNFSHYSPARQGVNLVTRWHSSRDLKSLALTSHNISEVNTRCFMLTITLDVPRTSECLQRIVNR